MIVAAAFGLAIGLVMGMVGGGGAVLVVPVLVYAVGLGVPEAMAIVAAISVSGLLGHLAAGSSLDLPVAAAMGGAAIIGAAFGPKLADRVSTPLLGRSFAVLVALVAVGVAVATIEGVGV